MIVVVMVDAVVRRGSVRVPDSLEVAHESVVDVRRRQRSVHRGGDHQSCAIGRRLDDVAGRRHAVVLRRSAGHVGPPLHRRTTNHLPLQSDRRPRRRDDRLSRETAQELARHHQTKTGIDTVFVIFKTHRNH